MSEIDETSYTHALSVLQANSIPSSHIWLERPSHSDPILLPWFRQDAESFAFSVCNPPFFGSEEEMREGQERKTEMAHAVSGAMLLLLRDRVLMPLRLQRRQGTS
jgi:methyltransferase